MVDSTGCSRSTVRGAHGAVGKRDLLPIVAVLLVPPDDDLVLDCALADFAAAEPALAVALETKVQARECLQRGCLVGPGASSWSRSSDSILRP